MKETYVATLPTTVLGFWDLPRHANMMDELVLGMERDQVPVPPPFSFYE